jgi:transposase InsO family protein
MDRDIYDPVPSGLAPRSQPHFDAGRCHLRRQGQEAIGPALIGTTGEDGKVWLFGVVEHWNAELLGWHVARRSTRFETIQALGMAVRRQFGQLGAGAARGLALRHDYGSAFMADVFQKRIRFWGMAPSYTFVGEPETNGCRERLFRTLKERVVHGRILQTIDEVRDAVRDFVARYNTEWLIEKNGHRSPDAPIRSLTAGRKPNASRTTSGPASPSGRSAAAP